MVEDFRTVRRTRIIILLISNVVGCKGVFFVFRLCSALVFGFMCRSNVPLSRAVSRAVSRAAPMCRTHVPLLCAALMCRTHVPHRCAASMCRTHVSHSCSALICCAHVPHSCAALKQCGNEPRSCLTGVPVLLSRAYTVFQLTKIPL